VGDCGNLGLDMSNGESKHKWAFVQYAKEEEHSKAFFAYLKKD
jgi:hypothetical protein